MSLNSFLDLIFNFLYYLVDFINSSFVISLPTDISNFIVQIFTYANVLFPMSELLPLGVIYASWFALRLNLAVLGAIKKYFPIA